MVTVVYIQAPVSRKTSWKNQTPRSAASWITKRLGASFNSKSLLQWTPDRRLDRRLIEKHAFFKEQIDEVTGESFFANEGWTCPNDASGFVYEFSDECAERCNTVQCVEERISLCLTFLFLQKIQKLISILTIPLLTLINNLSTISSKLSSRILLYTYASSQSRSNLASPYSDLRRRDSTPRVAA